MRALCLFLSKLFRKDFLLYYVILWTYKAINGINAFKLKPKFRNNNSNYCLNWCNFIIFKLKIPLYHFLKAPWIKPFIYFHAEYAIWFILLCVRISYNFKTSEFAWWLIVDFPDILYDWKMEYLRLKACIRLYRINQWPVTKRIYKNKVLKYKLQILIKIRKFFRLFKKHTKFSILRIKKTYKKLLRLLKRYKTHTFKFYKKSKKLLRNLRKKTFAFLYGLDPKTSSVLILVVYYVFVFLVILVILWIPVE